MEAVFSVKRVVALIKRDVALLKSSIITAFLVSSVIFILSFLYFLRKDHTISLDEFLLIFPIVFITTGVWFTFSLLKEVHNEKLNHFYLSLPVSPLERIFAIWFLSGVLYTLAFLLLTFVIGELTILIGGAIANESTTWELFSGNGLWQTIWIYLLIQPGFLFGAVSFRKNSIGRTILAFLLVFFGILIFNVILCFLFYGGAFDIFESEQLSSNAFKLTKDAYAPMGKWLFVIILGPMMLLASYFKLKEKEV